MQIVFQKSPLTVSSSIPMQISMTQQELESGLFEYAFDLCWNASDGMTPGAKVQLLWKLPGTDVQYMWHPECRARRVLDADWRLKMDSMLTGSAPMGVVFNGCDENIYTYAASEVRKKIAVQLGLNDIACTINVSITLELAQFNGQQSATTLLVRADHRRIPFHQAVQDTCAWWAQRLNIPQMPVPNACLMPLYSSWYNYHQNVSADVLEAELVLAKQMGMDTVILDDGWHSDHDGPGYGYTGDWEVSKAKFPDMAAHVARVHALGMKYMMWFSVPFMGYHAAHWEQFQHKILRRIDRNSCAVLDPRYPDVRDYLIGIYERAVRDYGLDGLKLDFIDQFEDRDYLPLHPDMDYSCVQEATERLMTDVMERVRAIRPDVMIEFRQRYIGPAMHRFGNMFRVADCAGDIVTNRVGVTDLRLMCGHQAVHSDMLTWSRQDSPEKAALQILNVLFGVIQFSQIIAQMPESHRLMTAFWLSFAVRHRKTLLQSEFIPHEPQFLYPVLEARDENTSIIALYARSKVVHLDEARPCTILINATHDPMLYLHHSKNRRVQVTVRNTMGEIVRLEETVWPSGVTACQIPPSGLAEVAYLD